MFSFLSILQYWRVILTVLILGGAGGYLWYTNAKIDSLSNENEQLVVSLKASQSAVKRLKQEKATLAIATERNAREKAKISSDLTKTQNELRKIHNETQDECANTPIPDAVLDRL